MAAFQQSVETFTSHHLSLPGLDSGLEELGTHKNGPQWQISQEKLIAPPSQSQVFQGFDDRGQAWPTPAVQLRTARSERRKAWLQVLGGFFLFMNTWGIINAFGVFQTYYSIELLTGTSESAIAGIGTSTSFLLCASPIFWGPLFDLGYARSLVVAGSLSIVTGIMMTSLCQRYWQLILAQGVCVGIGGGCAFVTAVSILPAYFREQRALAMGVAASGSSLGGIIYPIIFHELQPRIGFAWAVRIIGFIALATLAVPCAILRPRSQPKGVRKLIDTAMLKDIDFELFNVATFFGFVGQYIPFFFIQVYAISHGLGIAFWMLILLNVGSIPGRIIPSLIADKQFRPSPVLSTCTVCASILAFCWVAIKHSTIGLAFWAVLYGFFSGAFVNLQGPTVASMTTDMSTIGTKFGFNMFCGALGILIGSPVGGAILHVSWTGAQVFCGTTLLLSAMMAFITDRHWCITHQITGAISHRSGLSTLPEFAQPPR